VYIDQNLSRAEHTHNLEIKFSCSVRMFYSSDL